GTEHSEPALEVEHREHRRVTGGDSRLERLERRRVRERAAARAAAGERGFERLLHAADRPMIPGEIAVETSVLAIREVDVDLRDLAALNVDARHVHLVRRRGEPV